MEGNPDLAGWYSAERWSQSGYYGFSGSNIIEQHVSYNL